LGRPLGCWRVHGRGFADTPLVPRTQPVSGVVDGTLGEVAGTSGDVDAAPAAPGVDSGSTASGVVSTLGSALIGFAGDLPFISHAGDLAVVGAVGAEGLFHGPVSAPGDLTPTSAVTAGGPPIGLAAAVLGAGLLFFLARGRLGPAGARAHPSPVFATDTSPD